jgi:hypothetical protein
LPKIVSPKRRKLKNIYTIITKKKKKKEGAL